MTIAHINRIGTAVPPHDVHEAFVEFVSGLLTERDQERLFRRMVGRAGITHRFSFFEPHTTAAGFTTDTGGFYTPGDFPSTATRMARYEENAPRLAAQALDALQLDGERDRITHLIVASCTGFVAPGLDQAIVRMAGLRPTVERTLVGFMGCYAAVTSLRLAHHIVRSDPTARVLVVTLELCSLHFQESESVEQLLSMLLFGDGCAAALVTADAQGLALQDFRNVVISDSAEAITWRIGDDGFTMYLSGEVPIRIKQALQLEAERGESTGLLRGQPASDYNLWAVHAGGRSILDAVQSGLMLPPDALDWSRGVLRDYGNMSSATLMFILDRMLRGIGTTIPVNAAGFGVAFGPGLSAESFRFTTV